MIRKIIIFAIFAAVIAGIAYFAFFRGREDKIKKQFRLLSEYVSKEPNEKNLTMLYKTQNLPSLFADQCDLEFSQSSLSGVYNPEEIMSNVVRSRMRFSNLNLKLYDITIEYLVFCYKNTWNKIVAIFDADLTWRE